MTSSAIRTNRWNPPEHTFCQIDESFDRTYAYFEFTCCWKEYIYIPVTLYTYLFHNECNSFGALYGYALEYEIHTEYDDFV